MSIWELSRCPSSERFAVASLTDPDRLAAYKDALSNWQFGDGSSNSYIRFELSETAYKWVKTNLGDITLKELGRLMHEHVNNGGEIDEQPETRPEWDEHDFHWDLRFEINGVPTYFETRLSYRLPIVLDESSIVVVNIHAP